jgi:PAS domain S-box-containing protein
MTHEKNLGDFGLNTRTLEQALYKTPDPIVIIETTDLVISYANEAFFELCGVNADVLGKGVSDILPKADNSALFQNILQLMETGKTGSAYQTILHINKGGVPAPYQASYTATTVTGTKNNAGILLIFKEIFPASNKISFFRRNEFTQTDHRLEMALEAGNLGFYELDNETGLVSSTKQFKAIYGFPEDALITKADIFSRILPEYHRYLEVLISESIQKLSMYHSLYQIQLPDGSMRWIRGSGYVRIQEDRPVMVGVVSDITSLKAGEEKHAVLAAIVNSSDNAIISKTLSGYITSWNKAAERMYGYTEEEALGSHISMLIPEDRAQEEDEILRNVAKGNLIDHFETVRLTKDGRQIPVSLTVSPVKDNNGNIIGASKIARDITKDQQAEEKQAKLAAIVDNSDDAIISKDLQGIITSWNKGAEQIFGYTADEVIGRSITMLIPLDRLPEEDVILSKIRSGIRVQHFETIRRRKNGQEFPVSLSVSPIRDSKGRVIGASKIARDITEGRKAQEKHSMLAAIVNSSEDAIIGKSLDGIINSWNQAAEKLFGYTVEEAIGRHISMLIPEDLMTEQDHIISRIATGQKIQHFETIRVSKNGRRIPISLTVSPIQDSDGRVIGASKIARDISEKKMSEKALEQYARNLEIINSMAKTISEELDIQQILQKVSDATIHLIGAQYAAFFYKTADEDGTPKMLKSFSGKIRSVSESRRRTDPAFYSPQIIRVDDVRSTAEEVMTDFGCSDGQTDLTSYLEVPLFSKTGQVSGYLVFGHQEPGRFTREHENLIVGITLQAAAALENAKLYEEVSSLNAKKDEFIGLASHELKTPLTSMTGYLQILERQQQDDVNRRFVNKTIRKARKLTALVSDLLDVSKIEAGKLQLSKEPFNICSLVEEAIDLIRSTSTTHDIVLDTDLNFFLVEADKQRIEQVVVNLLTNAIKYSPAASEVRVCLQKEESGIRIGVQDQGIGIPQDKLSKIFSRFYRVEGLSPHMSGLGIGLYISHEIVERHDGKIWVDSTPGVGSTFWFNLPAGRLETKDTE